MISKKINIEDSNLYSALQFGSKGDSIVIKTKFPVIGIKGIVGVNIDGVYSSLKFEFKGSVDSVNWSDWMELSVENLQTFKFNKKHPFQIEYRITSLEDSFGYIYSINLEFEFEEANVPETFNQSPFKEYLTYLNRSSLLWATNVLEKMYKSGIVPEFIERGENSNWEDIDYLDFIWTPIYYNSLKISYDKIFKETLFRPNLLQDFLKQRDLYPGTKKDLGSLYYLAVYYFNEIRRRGTSLIKEDQLNLPTEVFEGIKVKGELLRLLNCNYSEIEDYILSGEDIGWYVGKSCPTYKSGTSMEGLIKGYEFTKDFEIFSNYPLFGSQWVTRQLQALENSLEGYCMKLFPPLLSSCGISASGNWSLDEKYSIKVNPKFSYEITFLLKGGQGQDFELGVNCFNSFGQNLGNLLTIDNFSLERSSFYKGRLNVSESNFTFVRAIIWSIDIQEPLQSFPLGLKGGVNLKYNKENISYIIPFLKVNGNGGTPLYLYDFKVRPCKITGSEYISQEDLLYLRVKNRSEEFSDIQISEIINKKLIPYNMELILETVEND